MHTVASASIKIIKACSRVSTHEGLALTLPSRPSISTCGCGRPGNRTRSRCSSGGGSCDGHSGCRACGREGLSGREGRILVQRRGPAGFGRRGRKIRGGASAGGVHGLGRSSYSFPHQGCWGREGGDACWGVGRVRSTKSGRWRRCSGQRSCSIQMGDCVPDLTGGGAMCRPDPESGGL